MTSPRGKGHGQPRTQPLLTESGSPLPLMNWICEWESSRKLARGNALDGLNKQQRPSQTNKGNDDVFNYRLENKWGSFFTRLDSGEITCPGLSLLRSGFRERTQPTPLAFCVTTTKRDQVSEGGLRRKEKGSTYQEEANGECNKGPKYQHELSLNSR